MLRFLAAKVAFRELAKGYSTTETVIFRENSVEARFSNKLGLTLKCGKITGTYDLYVSIFEGDLKDFYTSFAEPTNVFYKSWSTVKHYLHIVATMDRT